MIQDHYADLKPDTTDGVKVNFEEGWVHLRPSNTEPIVRIYAEGPSVEAAHAFAKRRPGPWQMTGCDTDGIDLRADGRYARVDFHKPVTDSNT